jgi:signal transduction histidine kinase
MPHEAARIRIDGLAPVRVEIDAARIVTVVRNLVENACRYSPDDRPVVVAAAADAGGEHLVVSVRDHGPGISGRMRHEVFETFVRADTGLDAEHGGIGLGLAIAKGFVEAHGGRIWIDDPADGSPGSVFAFTVPLAVDEVAAVHR